MTVYVTGLGSITLESNQLYYITLENNAIILYYNYNNFFEVITYIILLSKMQLIILLITCIPWVYVNCLPIYSLPRLQFSSILNIMFGTNTSDRLKHLTVLLPEAGTF